MWGWGLGDLLGRNGWGCAEEAVGCVSVGHIHWIAGTCCSVLFGVCTEMYLISSIHGSDVRLARVVRPTLALNV